MTIDYSKYYWKGNIITLRQQKEEDWQDMIHHRFDEPGRFFFNEEVDLPTDIEQYKKDFIASLEPGKLGYTCFAMENNDGKHVGVANLFCVDERNGKFGPIGIMVNPAYRGKGYALEAFRMLGHYMFNERRMHKWNSAYIEGNKASEALHKKAGFVVEGTERDVTFHEGRYWNVVHCGMTEQEFFANETTLPKLK